MVIPFRGTRYNAFRHDVLTFQHGRIIATLVFIVEDIPLSESTSAGIALSALLRRRALRQGHSKSVMFPLSMYGTIEFEVTPSRNDGGDSPGRWQSACASALRNNRMVTEAEASILNAVGSFDFRLRRAEAFYVQLEKENCFNSRTEATLVSNALNYEH